MKTQRIWYRLITFLCVDLIYLQAITCFADTELPGTFNYSFEGSTQYDRFSSSTDTILPLWYNSPSDSYFFFAPKQTFHSKHGAQEYNFGLGLRQLFADAFILGFNVYYDKRKSPTHHYHYQRGYGIEFLSQYIDARFNYYDPVNKPRRLGSSSGYHLGSEGIVRWERSLFEEPLEGFDFEVGCPLPIRQFRTRIFAGASFYDAKLSRDKSFFNLRSETHLTNWLIVDCSMKVPDNHHTLNDDDNIYFAAGFRVEIPFELGDLLKGNNPFRRKDRGSLRNRMFERVVRDLDIQVNDKEEYAEQTAMPLVYVNNTNTSGTENGSLEHPFSTLTAALASTEFSRIKNVYIFRGDGSSYTGNYALPANTTLWGSGYSGQFRLPTAGYPVLEGSGTDHTITVADDSEIMGCSITGAGSNHGIYGSNVSNVSVHHNVISGNGTGIYFHRPQSRVTINNNSITGNTSDGIYLHSANNVTISNNNISGNDDGIEMYNPQSNVTISGNTIQGNTDDGIYGFMNENLDIRGNTITGNANGIRLYEYNNLSDITISGNTVSSNTDTDSLLADSPGFTLEESIFYEYYNNYELGADPNSVADWFVFGSEHLDRYIVGTADDKYLNIIFDSPAGGVPPAWVSFGVSQSNDWNPALDFSAADISFDIRTDLGSAVSGVIAVQITAICNETGTLKTFRTPDANLIDIPASASGWVPVSVSASSLTYNEAGWATPDLTRVEKVEILFMQTGTDFTAAGNVYIDNFKATE
ncbi:MAG: hypothetical protein C4541_13010 [Candidatus Auribacter fodinae]|jgi:parallel beta-helix repeat protein|uniref:Right-handed parallel beta-helix repeat-containing protein n=1 Tax=Candidatus Auribacter fodinae TaxID=2093366 RepID=A0A3A4R1G8_9BACT|nr:MAG: hypothetical protein C4541_13010 [Candidatus Auribacter fodinae]